MSFNILAEIWGGDPRSFGKPNCADCQGEGCKPCDGRGTASGYSKPVRDRRLVKTILSNEFRPDIIMLQEAQLDTVEYIAQNAGYENAHFPSNGLDLWREWVHEEVAPMQHNGNAILIKKDSALKKVYHETIPVSIRDGYLVPNAKETHRLAVNVPVVVVEFGGKRVAIVNVHLEYGCRLSPLSIGWDHPGYRRRIQMHKIHKRLKEMMISQGEDRCDEVVIGGDFNDVSEFGTDHGGLKDIMTSEMRYINHVDVHGLQHLDTCANISRYSARLDHIFSTKGMESSMAYVPDEHYEHIWGWPFFGGVSNNWDRPFGSGAVNIYQMIDKYGSDHLPVVVKLHLKK